MHLNLQCVCIDDYWIDDTLTVIVCCSCKLCHHPQLPITALFLWFVVAVKHDRHHKTLSETEVLFFVCFFVSWPVSCIW